MMKNSINRFGVKRMIKEVYTITEDSPSLFNANVKRVIADLQSDGLKVEVQFSTSKKYERSTSYSAMIIGREK